jgi:hypothetical protein
VVPLINTVRALILVSLEAASVPRTEVTEKVGIKYSEVFREA